MLKSRYAFPLVALAVAVVTVLVASLGMVGVIRALPGRYAYYLPEPLQRVRQRSHPETLPTPSLGETGGPQGAVPASSTATTTAQPTATESVTSSEDVVPSLTPAVVTDAPTPSPTLSPTATPAPTATPLSRVELTGFRHEHQTWNNCGPATMTMLLSYWGCDQTQQDAAPVLKPDSDDKNVSPGEMVAYARDQGYEAIARVNGDIDRLKALLRGGFPVVVETWYVRDASDQLGHYRLITGYDDTARQFLTHDSLHGPDVPVAYRELDELWRVFNRLYLVAYTPEYRDELAAIVGSDLDDAVMYAAALDVARAEAAAPPGECVAYSDCADWVTFSWFNVGSSLTSLGRHEDAAGAYDRARQLGLHYRMLWYQFGPYESYYAVGRYDDVVSLANATLATAGNLEESYYWRGKARLAQGDVNGARSDFRAALRYHDGWSQALEALAQLEGS